MAHVRWLVIATMALASCGSTADPPGADAAGGPDHDAGPAPFLAPPPDGEGFQVALDPFSVPAGEELYYCYRLPMPVAGEFDLQRIEGRFGPGAHHLLVSTVDAAYDAGQGPCTANDFGFEVGFTEAFTQNLRFLSGAQTPYASDPRTELTLEPGMAFRIRAGSTLLLQLHWLNTGDVPLEAVTAINFWYATVVPTRLLESFFFYHTQISLPPHAQAEVAGRCLFPGGAEVVGMVSHMHARGIGFTTHRWAGALGELVYQEDSWQEPVMQMWPSTGLLDVPDGEGLEYRCFFDNTTDQAISEGDGAGDEMCMLIGLYAGGSATLFGFPGVDGLPGNPCTAVP